MYVHTYIHTYIVYFPDATDGKNRYALIFFS